MRLFCVAVLTSLPACRAGACRAGGAGYAMSFDGFVGQTIALSWRGTQASMLSVEYWVNILDDHLSQQPVFAYSVYAVAGRSAPYSNANEMAINHAPDYTRMFRASSSIDLSQATPYAQAGAWKHVAVVWTADPTRSPNGQIAAYIDGRLEYNTTVCAFQQCDMGRPLQPDGIVHLGQEADRPCAAAHDERALCSTLSPLELTLWPHSPRACPQTATLMRCKR
jgi:hypothetical protein